MDGELEIFQAGKRRNIARLHTADHLKRLALDFMCETADYKYTYNFTWLGLPVIQLPQDLLAMQEIIWNVKPEVIVETGIAYGGGLLFYASLLELLGDKGVVIGIDIDIRPHNRIRIESHPLAKRITMFEGSSIDEMLFECVRQSARGKKVLVALDSNHTHEHVLRELQLYSQLVGAGSYVVVFDTIIEDQPDGFFKNRPWTKTNNPKTAVREFLKSNDRFVVDEAIEDKLLVTVAREGYLRCVKDLASGS